MKPFIKHIVYGFVLIVAMAAYNTVAAQDTSQYLSKLIKDSIAASTSKNDTANFALDDDEDDEQIKPVKITDTVVLREVSDSAVKALQKRKEFDYANNPAYWQEEKVKVNSGFWYWVAKLFESGMVKFIFYTLLISVLLFALYRIIVTNKLFLFYKSPTAQKIEEEILIQQDNLPELIENAEADRNYRLALRYNYLFILKKLNDKDLIQYHPETTNYAYVKSFSANPHANLFKQLTNIYEYVWYGGFFIDEEKYRQLLPSYKSFLSSLK